MVIDYVLSRPSAGEEGELREAINEAVGVMPILLGHGDERAMTRLHTRNGQAESAEKAGAGSGPQQGE
jgi:peptidyl-tRNA hydrolase